MQLGRLVDSVGNCVACKSMYSLTMRFESGKQAIYYPLIELETWEVFLILSRYHLLLTFYNPVYSPCFHSLTQ